MKGLSKENFFFFDENCLSLKIVPNSIEHAYLSILTDCLDVSYLIFQSIDSPRAKWGEFLVKLLQKGVIEKNPTYFQIRNFFEIDLDFLLRNNKIDYVEQLLGALEYFTSINHQSYKFAARVMIEHKLYKAAVDYMKKSKKIEYNDPELHFMYAEFYYNMQNYKEAYYCLNECLRFLPSYYPAIVLKHKIEEIKF